MGEVTTPRVASVVAESTAVLLLAPGLAIATAIPFARNRFVVVPEEERGRAERFGESYETYRRATPALMPRLVPRRASGRMAVH